MAKDQKRQKLRAQADRVFEKGLGNLLTAMRKSSFFSTPRSNVVEKKHESAAES